jgi:hypothetical protein
MLVEGSFDLVDVPVRGGPHPLCSKSATILFSSGHPGEIFFGQRIRIVYEFGHVQVEHWPYIIAAYIAYAQEAVPFPDVSIYVGRQREDTLEPGSCGVGFPSTAGGSGPRNVTRAD